MRLRLLAFLLISACGTPPPGPAPVVDGGRPDGGVDAGVLLDAGPLPSTPPGQWTWVPVDGSECGAGARAGLGINRADAGEELFVFLQGGGACWNTGTCRPSLQQFGPLCDYAQACLLDVAGGQQPTSVYVAHPDPYPADGGGAWVTDRNQLRASALFDRSRSDNPFRHASFVYVPYCTGDLHAGSATRQYLWKPGLFDQPVPLTMHFSGAKNVDAYLARLKATFPGVKRIWLSGASAGAFGATFNLLRVQRAFPGAEVHLLADSGPFVPTVHWTEWNNEWNLQLPADCVDCLDGGFAATFEHIADRASGRVGLLSYDHDAVIAWFFLAPAGAASFVSPPVDAFANNLDLLLQRYDARAKAKYYVLPGREHVLIGGYGTVLADGGVSAPLRPADGGVDLRTWVDAWGTGVDGGWRSVR
jgi:hypothetical protein